MKIVNSIEQVREYISLQESKTIGLVPTMGALHAGHLALVSQSQSDNDVTIVSIFVNQKQFNDEEDYLKYPRDNQSDIQLLTNAGVDFLFIPEPEELYPNSFGTFISVKKLGDSLEGAARPGHFDGVTTIVAKLLNITAPTKAYFGKKDAQQLRIVQKMVDDLNMTVKIIACPTVREKDGLAMSSRNIRLTKSERIEAATLYQALRFAKQITVAGERRADSIIDEMTGIIKNNCKSKIDYISINDAETLEVVSELSGKILISLAVFFENVRLIDNIEVNVRN